MATDNESTLCSICSKPSAKSFCTGCKKYFCRKDLREHEQQLSIAFDNEIVRSHDELLDLIQKLEKSNYLPLDVFNQIEQWKETTINKVKKAADKAQYELTQLIESRKITIIKQFEPITKEIRSLREEENIVETDIDRLREKINDMRQKLEEITQKDTNKSIIFNDDHIDWNRLIYIRQEQQQNSKSFCIGCKKYICPKDLREHEQQLSRTFDNEIVRSHDELLDLIQKLEKSNYFSLHIFDQIEQWKQITINKVKKAADKAQHELTQLIENRKLTTIKQLEPITKEIRSLREEENIVETDIDRLTKKINDMRQKLEEFTQKDTNKSIIFNDDQIDWNRLIYIRQEQEQN
ncbi:unnamed protein product, partial [Rotaria sp. Silwood1]